MQLPDAPFATVGQDKVVGYLLNPMHAEGAGKAKFFEALGFHAEQWPVLADTLKSVALNNPIKKSMESRHGRKYIVDGMIETPSGKMAEVRTVWILDRDSEIPRLVTSYPHEESE